MIVEDVGIETDTTRGKNLVTSEVLAVSVRPKASQASRVFAVPATVPGL